MTLQPCCWLLLETRPFMTTSCVMKRFAPLYLAYYASNIFIFEVADWFHRNATKFNLVAEAIIENVLVNDLHPTKKHPLHRFFPGLVNKTNLLDPLPSNLEDQVPKIFKDHKISAVKPIDMVHTAVNTVICFDSEMRRQWRFDKLVYYMFIVTPLSPGPSTATLTSMIGGLLQPAHSSSRL